MNLRNLEWVATRYINFQVHKSFELSHNLEEIAKNARALVEKEFTYEKAAEMYRNILESTLG